MSAESADAQLLVTLYPCVFHVTDFGNADGIVRHGLHSTHQLLQRFDVPHALRHEILLGPRQHSYPLNHPKVGQASVRDQLPLSLGRLETALTDMTVSEWLDRLNSLVFFWPTPERVERLLRAPPYVDRDHHVLTVDTAELVVRHASRMLLAPLNTGATRPFAWPRGRDTFLPLGEYPLEERRARVGRASAVAEITVQDAVPDISEYILAIERWHGPQRAEMLWSRTTNA